MYSGMYDVEGWSNSKYVTNLSSEVRTRHMYRPNKYLCELFTIINVMFCSTIGFSL